LSAFVMLNVKLKLLSAMAGFVLTLAILCTEIITVKKSVIKNR
jgi:hypothetical protein